MIKIYTQDTCPSCKVLKPTLDSKDKEYEEVTDVEEINKLGIMSVPYIQVDDGELMDFGKAIAWINSL